MDPAVITTGLQILKDNPDIVKQVGGAAEGVGKGVHQVGKGVREVGGGVGDAVEGAGKGVREAVGGTIKDTGASVKEAGDGISGVISSHHEGEAKTIEAKGNAKAQEMRAKAEFVKSLHEAGMDPEQIGKIMEAQKTAKASDNGKGAEGLMDRFSKLAASLEKVATKGEEPSGPQHGVTAAKAVSKDTAIKI